MGGQRAAATAERARATTGAIELPPVPGLPDEHVDDVERVVVELWRFVAGRLPAFDDVLDRLECELVADVFATEVVANALVPTAAFGRFVGALTAEVSEPRASLLLLSARHAEWTGQAVIGERFVERGRAIAPRSVPLLVDAAWYAADRGAFDTATAMLRRAGAPEDDPDVAAWGSLVDSTDEVRALHTKAIAFARRPPQHRALMHAAATVAGGDGDGDGETIAVAASRPLAANFALFEGGAMTDFVAERGPLLSPSERRLARRWAGCRHAVLVADDDGRLSDPITGRTTSVGVPDAEPGRSALGVLAPAPRGDWFVLDGAQAIEPLPCG